MGKSTLFNAIVSELKSHGIAVGGIIAPEVRVSGVRLGFKVVDLMTGEEAWLARKDVASAIRVGSYGVLVDEASRLVEKAFNYALLSARVIAVDEVGPMELKLPVFKPLLLRALDSGKPAVLVVHARLSDADISLRLRDAEKVVLTIRNREFHRRTLPRKVLEIVSSTTQA